MLRFKTHYQQVPLETVRKILEEQIRQELIIESIIERHPGNSTGTVEEELIKEQQTPTGSGEFSQREAYKKP